MSAKQFEGNKENKKESQNRKKTTFTQAPDGVSQLIASRWKIGAALVVAFLIFFAIRILLPLADGIVLGLVFAYIARPIRKKFKKHRRLGALIASLCIFIPIVFIIGVGVVQILNQVSWILEHQSEVIGEIFAFVRSLEIPEQYLEEINSMVWNLLTSLLPAIGRIGFISYAWGIGMFVINFIVAMLLCYFLLSDGDKLYCAVLSVVPEEYKAPLNRYAAHLDLILTGVFIGNAYAALTVSVTSVIVFYAFGFSHVLALATLIFIASVIPLFAGYMVLIPLAVLRYFEQGFESAFIFLLVSSLVIYGPPELFLRPYLTSIKSKIHPMLLMLAFLGGAFVGGIAGFFAAPILLGALVAAYRAYQETIHPEILKQNSELKNLEIPENLDCMQEKPCKK
ncbi:MAG: AI-2E family transporter [Methanosarcinaceae archaeon]|nr:AI-2E family transporter [Methanosarcinaceae archaeon]MDD4331093.1 AI-2E family transporter [Methanosarcinaceae archaeon]MDD4749692.1 AI-2E family transporter [Methanosarcinaceae archaeon]